jgi:adenylate cyclase
MSDASANSTLHSESEDFSFRQHHIRALVCFAAAGTGLAHIHWSAIDWSLVGLTLFVVCYSLASYIYLKRYSSNQGRSFDRFMTGDAAMIGLVLNFTDFGLLPTILFVTMVQFNSLINGGLRKWAIDDAAMIGGMALGYFLKEPQWVYSDRLEISSLSLIGIFTYFCAYGLYAHKRMKKLDAHIKKLTSEHTLYKLRSYKLARYLTPTVWKAINEGKEQTLRTERKRVTVFFSDIQGFSTLSEELEAETLTELLNSYLTEMARIATKHKGTIDKFMGDAVMVIFGDAQSEGLKMDCLRCVSMAIEMRKKMKELQLRWTGIGIKNPLKIRMGINTGFCTVGSFGTSHYMDYTVLGTHVNLASRLESAAEPGEILISHETWSLVKDVVMCRDKGEIPIKGFAQAVKVYQVIDFRKDLGKESSWLEYNLEGFSMHLDMEKLPNYQKDKVIEFLRKTTEQLQDKIIN